MENHLSEREISRYRQRLSPVEELLHTDAHLTQCTQCRGRVLEELRLAAGAHLSYERMEGYVDQTLGPLERQKVLAHTRVCAVCEGELRDLEDLRVEMQRAPAHIAVTRGRRTSAGAAPERRRGFAALWQQLDVVAAAAAILLAVVLSVWWVVVWRSDSQPQDALTADERHDVLEATSTGNIVLAQPLDTLRGADRALLGPGAADRQTPVVRLDPVGEWVRPRTPWLQWSAIAGAMSYSVEIFDDNLTLIQQSPPLRESRWRIETPLAPGRVYLWQVTATDGAGRTVSFPKPPAPEARFGVLAASQVAELERVELAEPEAHLDLGALYAREGLLGDAERELQKIIPADSDFANAQRLLTTIRRLRIGAGLPRSGTADP